MNATRIEVSDGLAGAGGVRGVVLHSPADIERMILDAASFTQRGKRWRLKDGTLTRMARGNASSWESWKSSSLGNYERNASHVVSMALRLVPDWTGLTIAFVAGEVWKQIERQARVEAEPLPEAPKAIADAKHALDSHLDGHKSCGSEDCPEFQTLRKPYTDALGLAEKGGAQ